MEKNIGPKSIFKEETLGEKIFEILEMPDGGDVAFRIVKKGRTHTKILSAEKAAKLGRMLIANYSKLTNAENSRNTDVKETGSVCESE